MPNNLFKKMGLFMVIAILGKAFGFFRETLTAYYFGTSKFLDVFLVASMVPLLLFDGFGAAISTTVIPALSKIKSNKNKLDTFLSTLMVLVTVILGVFVILCVFLSPLLVRIIAHGFSGSILHLTIVYTKMLLPLMIFAGLAYISMTYLQFRGFYNSATLMGFVNSLSVIILIYVLGRKLGTEALVYGTLVGAALQFLILVPFLKKYKFNFQLKLKFTSEHKTILKISVPVILSSSVIQLNMVVDRLLATSLPQGSISSLNYANKVNTLVIGTFIMGLSSIIFPILSRQWADRHERDFFESMKKTLNIITLVMLPLSVYCSILSVPIIKVLFQRGAFTAQATSLTAIIFAFSIISLIGLSYRELLNKGLYAMDDTKGPFYGTFILVGTNIVFCLILVRFLAAPGLAFATTIANFLTVFVLIGWYKWRHRTNITLGAITCLVKSIVSVLFSGAGVYLLYRQFLFGENDIMTICYLAGYFILGYVLFWLINLVLREKVTVELTNRLLWGRLQRVFKSI